jgi:hypothetical protein
MIINKKIFFSVLICILAQLFFSTGIIAQDTIPKQTISAKKELYGHAFITNSLIEDPFVNTSFRLSAGVGTSSNYDVPLTIRGKEINGVFGQLTYGSFNVNYRQQIKDWLAFTFGAVVKGQLGSQRISMITEGIDIGSSFNFGWIFRVHESKKFMFSSSLIISSQSVTIFNLSDFVEKVIENGEITPDNKLVKTVNVTAGMLGIRTAYAFNRTFGCIAKLNGGYGESVNSKNKGYFDAGISVDADLAPKFNVPLGFSLGYDWNNFSNTDVDITNPQNIIFQINYTGKKDFDLGIEMNAQFFTLNRFDQVINLEVLFIKAGIAYYF